MRLTYLGAPGRRYLTARCAKPDIPPLRYFFAEEEGADGASEFVSFWQPYEGQPFIEKVERLPVQGAADGEYPPTVVRVTLTGGQVDTFFYAWDPNRLLRAGGLEFQGSFGYWSEQNGKPRACHLVNGRILRQGNTGLPTGRPPSGPPTAADLRRAR